MSVCVCIKSVLLRTSRTLEEFKLDEIYDYKVEFNLYEIKSAILADGIFQLYFQDLSLFREERINKILND